MLRDRIVCRVNNDAIQKRLLAEPNLKFSKADVKKLAHAMESAAKDVKELQNTAGNALRGMQEVHKGKPACTYEGEISSLLLPMWQIWPHSVAMLIQASQVFFVWQDRSPTECVQE